MTNVRRNGKQRLRDKETVAKAFVIAGNVQELWHIAAAKPGDTALLSQSPQLRAIVLATIFGRREGNMLRMPDPRTGEEVLLPRA